MVKAELFFWCDYAIRFANATQRRNNRDMSTADRQSWYSVKDIAGVVVSFLGAQGLQRSASVNAVMYELSNDEDVWHELCDSTFGPYGKDYYPEDAALWFDESIRQLLVQRRFKEAYRIMSRVGRTEENEILQAATRVSTLQEAATLLDRFRMAAHNAGPRAADSRPLVRGRIQVEEKVAKLVAWSQAISLGLASVPAVGIATFKGDFPTSPSALWGLLSQTPLRVIIAPVMVLSVCYSIAIAKSLRRRVQRDTGETSVITLPRSALCHLLGANLLKSAVDSLTTHIIIPFILLYGGIAISWVSQTVFDRWIGTLCGVVSLLAVRQFGTFFGDRWDRPLIWAILLVVAASLLPAGISRIITKLIFGSRCLGNATSLPHLTSSEICEKQATSKLLLCLTALGSLRFLLTEVGTFSGLVWVPSALFHSSHQRFRPSQLISVLSLPFHPWR